MVTMSAVSDTEPLLNHQTMTERHLISTIALVTQESLHVQGTSTMFLFHATASVLKEFVTAKGETPDEVPMLSGSPTSVQYTCYLMSLQGVL